MRPSLPLLFAALFVAGPPVALAQYVYLDTNGDGVCNSGDVLTSATTSVDIWFDTDHNKDGSLATCSDGTSQLTINSYEFILHMSGGEGTLTYGAYTNARSEMTTQVGPVGTGGTTDYWIGFGGLTANPPGLYKVGSLALTVTGYPTLQIAGSTPLIAIANTSFGSQCLGQDQDNTIKLIGTTNGVGDFTDTCGIAFVDPVRTTTWGVIKNTYR